MSGEMIERVAKAISGSGVTSPTSIRKARAAIEAMRDLTEEMEEAMDTPFHAEMRKQIAESIRLYGKPAYGSAPFSAAMWKAAIDEALK
jgi:hypothetical protein